MVPTLTFNPLRSRLAVNGYNPMARLCRIFTPAAGHNQLAINRLQGNWQQGLVVPGIFMDIDYVDVPVLQRHQHTLQNPAMDLTVGHRMRFMQRGTEHAGPVINQFLVGVKVPYHRPQYRHIQPRLLGRELLGRLLG